jgi:thiamine transport system substrate-binding protein
MRKYNFASLTIIISTLLVLVLGVSCTKSSSKTKLDPNDPRAKEVVVYTYDSFAGEWGPGPELAKKFEAATGYKLTLIDCGDAVQAFNRAVLEKDSVQADVIIGIDNYLCSKACSSGILAEYKPSDADKCINEDLRDALGGNWLLTPYDYNHFSMVYDTQSSVPAPTSIEDLTKDIYKKKIILMDPRTSTPGLGFVAWTVAVFGDHFTDYWKALKPNILTMTSGWSEGYGLFTDGEAPLVISYATDTAYHVEYDKSNRFTALTFDEGHIRQVEGFGLLKNCPNEKGAKLFMDYFITEEAQNILPLTQWMYPANKNVKLPDCFLTSAIVPEKTLAPDGDKVNAAVDAVSAILAQ